MSGGSNSCDRGAEPLSQPGYDLSTSKSQTFLQFFLAEQILGLVTLSAVLLTVLISSRVRRNAAWINFMVTSALLLF